MRTASYVEARLRELDEVTAAAHAAFKGGIWNEAAPGIARRLRAFAREVSGEDLAVTIQREAKV